DDVVPGITGVVDDDVERAEAFAGGAHEFIGETGGGDVAGQAFGAPAGGAHRALGFGGAAVIQVVDHHGGARGGQLLRDGSSDTPSGPGDDGALSFEREQAQPSY